MKRALNRPQGAGVRCVTSLAAGILAMLSVYPLAAAPSLSANGIVAVQVENHGSATNDVLATFGEVFARGDLPRGTALTAGANGVPLQLQLDAKATHSDGSLRHGVITIIFPRLNSGATETVFLSRGDSRPGSALPVVPLALPAEFDTVVTLKLRDRVISASAKALLATVKPKNWLAGPLVSEWWVGGPLRDKNGTADPHLYVQFGIRCYGKDRPVRVEVNVENDWAYVANPKTEFYDVQVNARGRTVYGHDGLKQPSHTRWRFGFWWSEPVSTYVRQNLEYLKRTKVIPNYDQSLSVSDAASAALRAKFESASHGPMTSGIIEKYMPETGGREDIAPLPRWQVLYLLTMDPQFYEIMLRTADEGASFSAHYRNEKTHLPLTLEDYPRFSTHSNLVGKGSGQLSLPDTGGYSDPLVPDAAHEPALEFLPYLVTGDRFYLEELQFWTEWNLSGTSPVYRNFDQGLVKFDQVRGQAWSLRTLAQAAYITPDSDTSKPAFLKQLKANLHWYETYFSANRNANKLGTVYDPATSTPWDGSRGISPFEDDFFTWVVDYIGQLGDADTAALLRWKAIFPIGRMTAPGFCPVVATAYYLRVRDAPTGPFYNTFGQVSRATISAVVKGDAEPDKLQCGSPAMTEALHQRVAGEFMSDPDDPEGYAAILQAALSAALDGHAPGAEEAWRRFMDTPVRPDFLKGPEWDILPWENSGKSH
jgi:hypothetical protein